MKKIVWSALLMVLAASWHARAQNAWPTPGNQSVGGVVQMCLNSSGQAIACTGTAGAAGYPAGATPIGGAFSGADTTTQAATLALASGKTTYICGFTVSGLGATGATTVAVTVATLVGSTTLTYSYVFPAGATVVATSIGKEYSPCIPASAAAAAITITVPGAAGNTATQINAWGFQF